MDWPGCTAKGAVEASPPLGAQSERNVKADVQNRIRPASVIETAGRCQAEKGERWGSSFPGIGQRQS